MDLRRLVESRRSLRSFSPREVEPEKLARMLDAARLSPSCANRQPWAFVAVRKEDPSRAGVEEALDEGNGWAKAAPVLVVSGGLADRSVAVEGRRYHLHDAGIALSALLLAGADLGLRVHPMAGWRGEPLRRALSLPGEFEPMAVTAVGYPGAPASLDEAARKKDERPSTRRPFGENAFLGTWGAPHPPPHPAEPPRSFEADLPLRFADLDAMGHVNSVSYLTLFEEARIAFAREVHALRRVEEISFVVAEASCRYISQVLLHDRVRVRMHVADLWRSSFRFRYLLFDPATGRPYAEGDSVQVAYDYGEKKGIPIPPATAERLRAYLGA